MTYSKSLATRYPENHTTPKLDWLNESLFSVQPLVGLHDLYAKTPSILDIKLKAHTLISPPLQLFDFGSTLKENVIKIDFPITDICILMIEDSEDSLYLKILACIPLMGILPAEIAMHSLRAKMYNTNDPKRNITLLKITNDYKACSTARALLTVACAVSALSFQILSAPIVIGLALASCCSAARSIYDAITNAKMMRAFEFAASQEID